MNTRLGILLEGRTPPENIKTVIEEIMQSYNDDNFQDNKQAFRHFLRELNNRINIFFESDFFINLIFGLLTPDPLFKRLHVYRGQIIHVSPKYTTTDVFMERFFERSTESKIYTPNDSSRLSEFFEILPFLSDMKTMIHFKNIYYMMMKDHEDTFEKEIQDWSKMVKHKMEMENTNEYSASILLMKDIISPTDNFDEEKAKLAYDHNAESIKWLGAGCYHLYLKKKKENNV